MEDDDVRDLFRGLGPVTIRRMFGGKGIYFDGEIVGIVMRDELLIKGDEASAVIFEAAGGERWAYEGKNGPVFMPYWRVPIDVIEDMDEMRRWAFAGFEAALRAAKQKGAAKRSPSKTSGRRTVRRAQ